MSLGDLGWGPGACAVLSWLSPVPPLHLCQWYPQPGRLPGHRSQWDPGGSPSPGSTFPPLAEWTHQSSSVSPQAPGAPRTERPAPPGFPGASGRTPRPHRRCHHAPLLALASPWAVAPEAAQAQLWRHGVSPLHRTHMGLLCPALQQAPPRDSECPVLTGSVTSPPQDHRAASAPLRCPALTAHWHCPLRDQVHWLDHLPGTAKRHSRSDTCLFGRGRAGTQARGQLGWPGCSQSQRGRDATSLAPSAPRRGHSRCKFTQGPSRRDPTKSA